MTQWSVTANEIHIILAASEYKVSRIQKNEQFGSLLVDLAHRLSFHLDSPLL